MASVFAYTNGFIMVALSILHFYWAAGGQRGLAQSVPTDTAGNRVLRTGVSASVGVGTGLLGFSLYYFSIAIGRATLEHIGISHWVIWVLALIFGARAIGDFRYVGFFKTVKNTEFALMDTRWYTPLCLYLALSSMWIGMNR